MKSRRHTLWTSLNRAIRYARSTRALVGAAGIVAAGSFITLGKPSSSCPTLAGGIAGCALEADPREEPHPAASAPSANASDTLSTTSQDRPRPTRTRAPSGPNSSCRRRRRILGGRGVAVDCFEAPKLEHVDVMNHAGGEPATSLHSCVGFSLAADRPSAGSVSFVPGAPWACRRQRACRSSDSTAQRATRRCGSRDPSRR